MKIQRRKQQMEAETRNPRWWSQNRKWYCVGLQTCKKQFYRSISPTIFGVEPFNESNLDTEERKPRRKFNMVPINTMKKKSCFQFDFRHLVILTPSLIFWRWSSLHWNARPQKWWASRWLLFLACLSADIESRSSGSMNKPTRNTGHHLGTTVQRETLLNRYKRTIMEKVCLPQKLLRWYNANSVKRLVNQQIAASYHD